MKLTTGTSAELPELVERFLCSPRPPASSELVAALRNAAVQGSFEDVAAALRSVVSPSVDYTTAQSLCRIRQDLRGKIKPNFTVRLAILGGVTTKQIAAFIDLGLFAAGVEAEIYESDFGTFQQEIVDRSSGLYSFRPKVVWLAVSRRDLGPQPSIASDVSTSERFRSEELDRWSALWTTLHEHLRCQVIQNNFVLPLWRPLANHEMRSPGSPGRHVSSLNRSLCDAALPFVTIHDVDHLAASQGRWSWDDPRFVHYAKLPCAPEYLMDYAYSVASLVGVQLGLAKKCLVLDLDNTLWGGVIGDDGLGGIRLGQGSPEGEAFLAFQEYLKSLRQRGILLAVCSKNNEETAREVFLRHSEMALRLDDIACFVANWDDKAKNIRTIATNLNIGLNSLVFVDDNPAERAIVRQVIPEVAVPELPDDVTGYIHEIEKHRYFQTLSIAEEDLKRTEYYKADAIRHEAETSASDIETFLRSLQMVAWIAPVEPSTLERTVQLIQRSNQFNLTTRRYSAGDLTEMMEDPSWLTATVHLRDRFGDNGLISVVLSKANQDSLDIDTWLMSCRVLKRGVEQCVLNHLCLKARELGLRSVRGEYIPTHKNKLVSSHYEGLGFQKTSQSHDGRSVWKLDLTEWRTLSHFISVEVRDELMRSAG
jgi:FkbH-like protein